MADKLNRPEELAKLLGLEVRTLANWRASRIGPAFHKIGGRVRYSEKDIEDWCRSTRTLTGSEPSEREGTA